MSLRFPFAVIALAALAAAQDRPTFRADVFQVHVDAEVMGRDGRIVTGLLKDDFLVLEEGQAQSLLGFAAEEQPLDIVLLFDVSASMRSRIAGIATVAGRALRELKRGDRVAVMTLSEQSQLVAAFTDNFDSVERNIQGILSLRFGGLTYIQRALIDAANYFLRDPRSQRRRAILIITDNLGIRTHDEMTVVHHLWEADALLCGLIFPDRTYPVRRAIVAVFAPHVLFTVGGVARIAEKTGGETIRSGDPSSAFPEMMRRIRSRYSLYYAAPEGKPGLFRSIRVELAHEARVRFPQARVYARRGYRLTQLP